MVFIEAYFKDSIRAEQVFFDVTEADESSKCRETFRPRLHSRQETKNAELRGNKGRFLSAERAKKKNWTETSETYRCFQFNLALSPPAAALFPVGRSIVAGSTSLYWILIRLSVCRFFRQGNPGCRVDGADSGKTPSLRQWKLISAIN